MAGGPSHPRSRIGGGGAEAVRGIAGAGRLGHCRRRAHVMHQYTYYGCPAGYIETVQSADISSVVSNVMPIDEPWWVQ